MEQNGIGVLKIGIEHQKLVNAYLVRALRNTQVKITDYFGQVEGAIPPQKIDFDREYIACALDLAAQAAGFEMSLKRMAASTRRHWRFSSKARARCITRIRSIQPDAWR